MGSIISSLFGNWKTIVLAVLVAVSIATASYIKGRDDGVELTEYKVLQERTEWQALVENEKKKYQTSLKILEDKHTVESNKLQEQITILQNNPNIIERYVPIEHNSKLPYGLVLWHDRLVKGEAINTMLPDNFQQTCDYTINDLGSTLSTNYTTCRECMSKLTTLQGVVKEYLERQKALDIKKKVKGVLEE